MRTFRVNLSGQSYEVEVEEVKGGVAPAAQAAPTPAAAVAPKPAQARAAAPTGANARKGSGTGAVKAPMPGTLLSFSVEEGESVKAGQVLCMLEAMKMENEISAVADAVIQSIEVKVGDQIAAGETIFVLG